jgi:hypothetical protein
MLAGTRKRWDNLRFAVLKRQDPADPMIVEGDEKEHNKFLHLWMNLSIRQMEDPRRGISIMWPSPRMRKESRVWSLDHEREIEIGGGEITESI